MSDETKTPDPGTQGESKPESSQEPTTQDPQGGDGKPQSGEAPTGTEPTKADELLKEIEKLKSENFNYREERRKAKEETEKKEREEAEKRGEFEKLYQSAIADKENLEKTVTADVERYKTETTKMLDHEKKNLTPDKKKEFESLFGDIDDPLTQLRKLQVWKGLTPQTANTANTPPSSPASPDDKKNELAKLRAQAGNDPAKLREIYSKLNSADFT